MSEERQLSVAQLLDDFAAEVDGDTRRVSTDPPSRAAELREEILRRLEVDELAHEMAEESSRSLVESCSTIVEPSGVEWLEIGEGVLRRSRSGR